MDELKTRTLGPKSGTGEAVAAIAELAIEANRAREGASFIIDYSALPRVLSLYAFWRMKKACFFCPWSEMRPLRLKSSWRPGIDAAGGAEVHQEPGAGAAELRDFVEHCDLVAVDIGLILLGPESGVGVAAGAWLPALASPPHSDIMRGLW